MRETRTAFLALPLLFSPKRLPPLLAVLLLRIERDVAGAKQLSGRVIGAIMLEDSLQLLHGLRWRTGREDADAEHGGGVGQRGDGRVGRVQHVVELAVRGGRAPARPGSANTGRRWAVGNGGWRPGLEVWTTHQTMADWSQLPESTCPDGASARQLTTCARKG